LLGIVTTQAMMVLLPHCRYKQEILRLRKLAGSELPCVLSAGTADSLSLPRARRTVSHEL